MPFYMISNRDSFGTTQGPLSYWVNNGNPVDHMNSWEPRTSEEFRATLLKAAGNFPSFPDPQANHEDQKHVCFFVHGFNNTWAEAARRYAQVSQDLFEVNDLGVCVAFDWPSEGRAVDYLPDRATVKQHAVDLTDTLSIIYDYLLDRQRLATQDPNLACKAKFSVIAHSMGNYLLQEALNLLWVRKNKPLLVSMFNQCIMVAGDVDNDLFRTDQPGDGAGIANLSYRVTALYSGKDAVLGASAGLKHFGKRRLGRSGLDVTHGLPDNVWGVDCTPYFNSVPSSHVHSAYFDQESTRRVMHSVLRGVDRNLILA